MTLDDSSPLADDESPDHMSADTATALSDAADYLAGATRALLLRLLQAMPRTPSIRFFAPKESAKSGGLQGEWRDGRLRYRLGFLCVSAGAATVLFKAHRTAKESGPQTINGRVLDLIGGALGGGLFGFLMTFAPRPDLDAVPLRMRVRAIPFKFSKEAIGFGAFFATHAWLAERFMLDGEQSQQQQQPQQPQRQPAQPKLSPGSELHLRTLGASATAGAVAGAAYHVTTYPIAQAQAHAAPDVSIGGAIKAARAHGVSALTKGMLRTAGPGLLTGALTFGVYDSALRAFVDG